MSIPFSGTFTKSGGLFSAISKQVKLVNLKPVKKVLFKFDPFHDKAAETRLVHFFYIKIYVSFPYFKIILEKDQIYFEN